MNPCLHYHLARERGSLISHDAAVVTGTSLSSCTSFTEKVFEKRASAPELGSRGRPQN
jgi:hypothetical protein